MLSLGGRGGAASVAFKETTSGGADVDVVPGGASAREASIAARRASSSSGRTIKIKRAEGSQRQLRRERAIGRRRTSKVLVALRYSPAARSCGTSAQARAGRRGRRRLYQRQGTAKGRLLRSRSGALVSSRCDRPFQLPQLSVVQRTCRGVSIKEWVVGDPRCCCRLRREGLLLSGWRSEREILKGRVKRGA